ncbi:hypothetical protein MBLNU230_g0062t1 [Neophaeotheca triangularis]
MGDDDPGTVNRKERRRAARESGKPMAPGTSTPKIKLEQPDRSGPKAKTLMEIADEKRELLEQGQPFEKQQGDGLARDENGKILETGDGSVFEAGLGEGEPIGPLGQSIFYALVGSMLHFTLDVLVFSQYRQEIQWDAISKRTATILPVLFFLIYIVRTETAERFPKTKQVFFFVVAIIAGCHLITVGNTKDYYAVMKRAPPIGTLWLWSVVEMDLGTAFASVVIDFGYMWWKGYTAF